MFLEGETCILNKLAIKGLPNRIGERCVILENNYKSSNYDYLIEFDNRKTAPVKEIELNKLTETDKKHMEYIFTGNTVIYYPSRVKVKILKVDYLLGQAEVEFSDDHTNTVVRFNNLVEAELESDNVEELQLGYFAELGLEVGKLVDEKQKAYGDSVTKCYEIMKVLLKDYKNDDNTYTIPESLLPQMLLDVRKIDKMNRRFSNPDGDLMGENPFQDDVGYSMLGVRMVNQLNKK